MEKYLELIYVTKDNECRASLIKVSEIVDVLEYDDDKIMVELKNQSKKGFYALAFDMPIDKVIDRLIELGIEKDFLKTTNYKNYKCLINKKEIIMLNEDSNGVFIAYGYNNKNDLIGRLSINTYEELIKRLMGD